MSQIVDEKNELTVTKLETKYARLNIDDANSILNYGYDLLSAADEERKNKMIMAKSNIEQDEEANINIDEVITRINKLNDYLETDKDKKKKKKVKEKVGLIGKLQNAASEFVDNIDEKLFGRDVYELNVADEAKKINEDIDAAQQLVEKTVLDILNKMKISTSIIESDTEYAKELQNLIIIGEQDIKEYEEKIEKLKNSEDKDLNTERYIKDAESSILYAKRKIDSLKRSLINLNNTISENTVIRNKDGELAVYYKEFSINNISDMRNDAYLAVSVKTQQTHLEELNKLKEVNNSLLRKNSEIMTQNIQGINEIKEKGMLEIDTLKSVKDNLNKVVELVSKGKEIDKEMIKINAPILDGLLSESNNLNSTIQDMIGEVSFEEQGFQKRLK